MFAHQGHLKRFTSPFAFFLQWHDALWAVNLALGMWPLFSPFILQKSHLRLADVHLHHANHSITLIPSQGQYFAFAFLVQSVCLPIVQKIYISW